MSHTLLETAKALVMALIQVKTFPPEDMHQVLQQTYATLEALQAQEDAYGSVAVATPETPSKPVNWRKSMTKDDIKKLKYAKLLLEQPRSFALVWKVIGYPVERAIALLPDKYQAVVADATRVALHVALWVAISTMDEESGSSPYNKLHKFVVTATGAVGGTFGLLALPIELPISTTIMLRSIADIARSAGERLTTPEAKLACLEVFALGDGKKVDGASELGYFGVRAWLAQAVTDAAKHLADRGLAQEGAPALVKLTTQIASRFGIAVSEKAAVQAVPAIGAACGGGINLAFINYYQDIARGHFTVRMLERQYGPDTVRKRYEEL